MKIRTACLYLLFFAGGVLARHFWEFYGGALSSGRDEAQVAASRSALKPETSVQPPGSAPGSARLAAGPAGPIGRDVESPEVARRSARIGAEPTERGGDSKQADGRGPKPAVARAGLSRREQDPEEKSKQEGFTILATSEKTHAVYDASNAVIVFDPEEAIVVPKEGKILFGRKSEIARDLKSETYDQAATLRFENETTSDVLLFWIDYQGKPVLYTRIPAGESTTRPTYMTHPWVVTDLDGNPLGDIKPELPNQVEVIPIALSE
jgi:hypothetical protein